MAVIDKRLEFVLLFDVWNGNPNGDPDQVNMPRIDPETSLGLVTDVALKRKLRNYVELTRRGDNGYRIYVENGSVLNRQHQEAYDALGATPEKPAGGQDKAMLSAVTAWMCRTFFDVRAFGAVMSTAVDAGQVRGPVQVSFAESIEPITVSEITITRMAVTNEAEKAKLRTIGEKFIVPYGLYRAHGFISAYLARETGFSDQDLALLWEALANMFEHDRSASRGVMATRGLFVFEHSSALGNAPAHTLFDLVEVTRAGDLAVPARSFSDYAIRVDEARLPKGVRLRRLV